MHFAFERSELRGMCMNDRTPIFNSMLHISKRLQKKYYPDCKEQPTEWQVASWLNADIEDIIMNHGDEGREYVLSVIHQNMHGETILKDYIEMDRINEAIAIRKDFTSALRSVKRGTELSHKLGYGFSKADIAALAALHKSNKFRRKIEDLLEDCNFHTECGDFHEKNYDKYLTAKGE